MMTTRPYLIRAFYEWIVDNDCTPHIVVNAHSEHVEVPQEYIEGGQIVLNISMTAVQGLELANDSISFNARFAGVAKYVYIPIDAVMAIYARENGRGMVFADDDDQPPPTSTRFGKRTGGSRAHLTVVK